MVEDFGGGGWTGVRVYVGILTEEEAEAVGRMTGQSVTKGSARGYSATWTKRLEFGQAQAGKNRPGVWLEGAEREETKAQWLVLFLEYLYRERGLRGAKEASATMSALRYFWTKEGRGSGFFAAALVTAAKKGARRSTEEVRGRAELKGREGYFTDLPRDSHATTKGLVGEDGLGSGRVGPEGNMACGSGEF